MMLRQDRATLQFRKSWLTGMLARLLTRTPDYASTRPSLPRDLRGLLCAGLYSSASTWMLNLVAQILKTGGRAGVKTIYLDEMVEAAASGDRWRNIPPRQISQPRRLAAQA